MSSQIKWLVVGPLLTVIGFTIFYHTLGTLTALFSIPFISIGGAMWGYGWINKVDFFDVFASWMNSDKWGVK